MSVLEELQATVRRLAAEVGPSVIGIGRGWGRGSGMVIAPGQVLSAAHALARAEPAVAFADGRIAAGRVAGVDEDLDLAVVRVDTGDAPPLAWAPDAGQLEVGTPGFALSNPGGRGLRTTFGLVSATARTHRGPRGRRIRGSIEHTAPLPRGSAGAPLVDGQGRLLGLNVVRMDDGFILALPADTALRERVRALGRGEEPARPRLGIAVAPPWVARRMRRAVGLSDATGVLVRQVQEGSPASRGGLAPGDLITEIDGRPVEDVDALHDALQVATSARIDLTVLRGVEERRAVVALDTTPAPGPSDPGAPRTGDGDG